ncbi:MAG: GAF domain-containing protein [Anaerolineales bacterium]|nr:GAF domain-containing protein [Anaerolineales bacterium]
MLERIKKILALPEYENERETGSARLLNIIVSITLVGLILGSIANWLFAPEQIGFLHIILIAMIVANTLVFVMLRFKMLKAAASIFLLIFGTGITAMAINAWGVNDITVMGYPILVAMASVFIDRRGTITFGILSFLAVLGLYFSEIMGFLVTDAPSLPWIGDLLFITAMIVLAGFVVAFTNQGLIESLNKTRQNEMELITSNRALQAIQENLEERVEERTHALERRARFLEAAAEVGRAATSIYSLEELLPQITEFISELFGFYQVGIFTIDDIGEYAILRAANSEGGKKMLARNHRLKVGAEGIVGYVTKTGEARVALDVGEDAVHFNTPELPHTRSEMALPLFAGGRLFGALDVQSTEANAFAEEDIAALRVLANQVSMSINNAELFGQLQQSLESERRAYGEITRGSWRDMLRSRGDWGYRLENKQLTPSRGTWSPEMIEAARERKVIQVEEKGKTILAAPLNVSNQNVGVIRFTKEGPLSPEETNLLENLSTQISLALETARLYQETQKRAAREQLTTEISTQIRRTLDIDTVLQTAVREFGEVLNAEEVIIRLGDQDSNGDAKLS